MIPKETLISVITDFDNKRRQLDADFEKETKETWTLEKFQEWDKYREAWRKLQDVVEFHISPLTQ